MLNISAYPDSNLISNLKAFWHLSCHIPSGHEVLCIYSFYVKIIRNIVVFQIVLTWFFFFTPIFISLLSATNYYLFPSWLFRSRRLNKVSVRRYLDTFANIWEQTFLEMYWNCQLLLLLLGWAFVIIASSNDWRQLNVNRITRSLLIGVTDVTGVAVGSQLSYSD